MGLTGRRIEFKPVARNSELNLAALPLHAHQAFRQIWRRLVG
jgi:hypothetical protein